VAHGDEQREPLLDGEVVLVAVLGDPRGHVLTAWVTLYPHRIGDTRSSADR
jgi:hypothetical protein